MMIDSPDNNSVITRFGHSALTLITLAAILLIAVILRFTGLNWDQAQWIHPDEGHMRTITGAIHWPIDPTNYFDTATSPLNPRNHDHVYSYGTLPLFATRAVAEWLERGCAPQAPAFSRFVTATVLTRLGEKPMSAAESAWGCRPGTFTWTYNAFVGRHLSALADVGTVILIGILGQLLYSRRAGLLAAALAATTAFMIQQAHFYTVDSAATFFTVLTALFAAKAGQQPPRYPPWLWLGLGGASTGLAAACKVSAALSAGLVALGALQWLRRAIGSGWRAPRFQGNDSRPRTIPSVIAHSLGSILLAAILSLIAFRVGQPYAFQGPGFFGLRPNTAWFDRLEQISEEQSGVIDFPSGRQWTNRAPLIFPLRNLGLWGLGLPLAVTAAVGWAAMGRQLLRGDRRHFVLWLWTTAYVIFYATRWVKAMRYFLPVYPLIILMAAYTLDRWITASLRSKPAPASAAEAEGRRHHRSRSTDRRRLPVALAAITLTAIVVTSTVLWGLALFGIYMRPHTRIAASRWIYANVPDGSAVANEHWDWGLPLRIDGHDTFRAGGTGPTYSQVTLALYDEDTPEKRAQLLAWLDKADYIFIASNRLYGSIPRLPERYPLTSLYYRKLFAGELGFELAARVTSYIRIGPFSFPDQENPFPLMQPGFATQGELIPIPIPPAEESFSVYDHPDCLVFRKTAAYSHESVAQILGAVDLTDAAAWQTPHKATPKAIHLAHTGLFYIGLAITAVVGGVGLLRPDA